MSKHQENKQQVKVWSSVYLHQHGDKQISKHRQTEKTTAKHLYIHTTCPPDPMVSPPNLWEAASGRCLKINDWLHRPQHPTTWSSTTTSLTWRFVIITRILLKHKKERKDEENVYIWLGKKLQAIVCRRVSSCWITVNIWSDFSMSTQKQTKQQTIWQAVV